MTKYQRQIEGLGVHELASGPCTVTKVVLTAGLNAVSFDLKTTRPFAEGGYRGIGSAFSGNPVHLFNATAMRCDLAVNEQLTIELFRKQDALDVEVAIEGRN
jgi:hypothetical protein